MNPPGRLVWLNALLTLGVAGLILTALGVGGFVQVYGYVPQVVVGILTLVGGVFVGVGLLAHRNRTRDPSRIRWNPIALPVVAGVALSLYGVGGLKLSFSGFMLFPSLFAVAALMVIVTLGSPRASSLRRIITITGLAMLLFIAPGFLFLLPLYTEVIYLPGILIVALLVSLLMLLFSITVFSAVASVMLEGLGPRRSET